MYKSFEIENFRCFRKLEMHDLGQINLIAGKNNVGKSALLEALFLHCGAPNPELAMRLNFFRGLEEIEIKVGPPAVETPWQWLFPQANTEEVIGLRGEDTSSGWRSLHINVVRDPEKLTTIGRYAVEGRQIDESLVRASETPAEVLELGYTTADGTARSYHLVIGPKTIQRIPHPPKLTFQTHYLASRKVMTAREVTQLFGKLIELKQENVLRDVLKLIEPKLADLMVIPTFGIPMIFGDVGLGRRLPLVFMGEGMVRLSALILSIADSREGVVLVDEIENGLHHSIMSKVWEAIGRVAADFGTQVFATTHSLECIRAAYEAFSNAELPSFRLHRLQRVGDSIEVVSYDVETLEAAIETGLEVR